MIFKISSVLNHNYLVNLRSIIDTFYDLCKMSIVKNKLSLKPLHEEAFSK